jgi:hypothetical protein
VNEMTFQVRLLAINAEVIRNQAVTGPSFMVDVYVTARYG